MKHDLSNDDVLRLIASAFSKVVYYQDTGMGYYPPCRNDGEVLLLDALEYLAWGDTAGARSAIESYEEWLATGEVPRGYRGDWLPTDE